MASALLRLEEMIVALPIEGESFLLRRDGRSVLVDGGWKRDNVAKVLTQLFSDMAHLDIVLCTHGDGDHAGGLPNLLNQWAGRVGQVWLPGQWVDVIPKLVLDPKTFLTSLVRELKAELEVSSEDIRRIIRDDDDQAEAISAEDTSRSKTKDDISSDHVIFGEDGFDSNLLEAPKEPEWFASLRNLADEIIGDVAAERAFASARNSVLRRRRRAGDALQSKIANYWLKLIKTAEAVRGIAVSAIRHEIPTRWFDFEEFARTRKSKGGVRGFLVPINAIEQAPPPTIAPLYRLLTQVNEESLVFLAPPKRDMFGVLFCGDSPLGDGVNYINSFLPCRDYRHWPMVVTAPHHGSESNGAAYNHLRSWANTAVLLRTGGSTKQPGKTFLAQNHCLKLCAKCPKARRKPLVTGVIGYQSYWPWMMAIGRRCKC